MTSRTVPSAILAAIALGVAGCSGGDATSFNSVKGDLTPELQGAVDRPIDVSANMAYTNNMDARSFWDDIGRVFYTDHASKLSPYPILMTSGNPR
jgi:hypothetical protein